MFERFTEQARRAIFFARYEASQFGSQTIEIEHLLLGILREYPEISIETRDAVRKRITELSPVTGEKISTSVDLPLSSDAKRALAFANEEVTGQEFVGVRDLLSGLLRIENSLAATICLEFAISPSKRPNKDPVQLQEESEAPSSEPIAPGIHCASSTLAPLVERLEKLVAGSEDYLNEIGEVGGDHVLKRSPWTRKEALGHLIDWASTHHQWFARVLTEPRLSAHSYPQEEWVSAQEYRTVPWRRLVRAWLSINRLLTHVASRIPEAKLTVPCRIGIDPVKPFIEIVQRYIEHHEDLLGQILARN
jgi:hypothetical protein